MTLLVAAALAALTVAAAPAAAGDFNRSATSCVEQKFEQPFLRWVDPLYYVLTPNGGLEASTVEWTLAGGAKVVSGNEPFYVRAAGDRKSLSLPAGSSARTRPMCAKLLYPDLRFLAVNKGSLLSLLKVEVLFEDLSGGVQALEIARVSGDSTWKPTLPLPFVVSTAAPLSADGTVAVAFRFTPLGTKAAWTIDDVYVDPFKGR